MNKRQRKKAFKTVLKSLSGIPLFRGMYDAEHGNDIFMYGIETVMEMVADGAGCLEKYEDMFWGNMQTSEEYARLKEQEHG